MARTPSLNDLLYIFPRNIYKPGPTYNDLTILAEAISDAIANISGGGCENNIDLKDRLGVPEVFDLGDRLDIANANWNFCNRID